MLMRQLAIPEFDDRNQWDFNPLTGRLNARQHPRHFHSVGEREDHFVHQLIAAHSPRDGRQLGVGRHHRNEVFRIKLAQGRLTVAAREHGDVINVGVLDHGGESGFGITRAELMRGVFFPKIIEIHKGYCALFQSLTRPGDSSYVERVKLSHLTLALPALTMALVHAQPRADLIVRNGKILTMEPGQPTVQAVAIGNGVILGLGTNAQVTRFAVPSTKIVDLNGAFAMPGLIESHGHFMGIGQFKRSLNLRDAKKWDDIVAMVAAAAKEAKPGEWIIGRGFHQSKWTEEPKPSVQGFPVHQSLSKVSPNNPVLLTHASGHAAMVNQKAMEVAGITRESKDPKGGEILRDAAGNPTGLLNETAQGLTRSAYESYLSRRTIEQRKADSQLEATLAAQECVRKGITSFQDAGSGFDTVDLLREMYKDNKLDLRLWVMLRESNDRLKAKAAQYRFIGESQEHLTVRAIKRQIDGALGSRGAWLLAPYEDMPSSSGLNTESLADIEQTAQYAKVNGFQLCVHAIGDRGNRETLDIFERTLAGDRTLRWRVEHAQHLSTVDIPRFGKLGVIAAMQAVHCTSDAPYVLARLGKNRAEEGAYMWRSLIDSGAKVTNGTDAPVEDVDPIPSLYASVTRKLADGKEFFPKQKMTRMEALRSYTLNAAYAAFEEERKGSLKVGKLGDLTVMSKDFLTAPDADIAKMEVLYTIIGGKVVHQRR